MSTQKCAAVLVWLAVVASSHAIVTIDYVTVGDIGNANDSTGYGSVGYGYRISKYEVTNAQYAEFLNAKASSDPNGLYNTNMDSTALGGIIQSGSSGSFTYSLKANMGDKPVNWVSFVDAMRFSNWMNNGQGGGSTESGAYDMTQSASTVPHSSLASVWIPTENEWYKAALYQPVGAGGDTDSYWLYPTKSNTQPTSAIPPSGITGAANYFYNDNIAPNGINGGYAVTQSGLFSSLTNYLSNVGAYGNSSSYYGTYDQGGNVWEWTEGIIGAARSVRGGSWTLTEDYMRSSYLSGLDPTFQNNQGGFRLASAVPEPTRAILLMTGLASLFLRRRRLSAVD